MVLTSPSITGTESSGATLILCDLHRISVNGQYHSDNRRRRAFESAAVRVAGKKSVNAVVRDYLKAT
jgi:hypothetical protein